MNRVTRLRLADLVSLVATFVVITVSGVLAARHDMGVLMLLLLFTVTAALVVYVCQKFIPNRILKKNRMAHVSELVREGEIIRLVHEISNKSKAIIVALRVDGSNEELNMTISPEDYDPYDLRHGYFVQYKGGRLINALPKHQKLRHGF